MGVYSGASIPRNDRGNWIPNQGATTSDDPESPGPVVPSEQPAEEEHRASHEQIHPACFDMTGRGALDGGEGHLVPGQRTDAAEDPPETIDKGGDGSDPPQKTVFEIGHRAESIGGPDACKTHRLIVL